MQQKNFNTAEPRSLALKTFQLLMDCNEREIMNQPPLSASTPYTGWLIRRKLISVEPYINAEGKTVMSVYITYEGKRFLNWQLRTF